MIPTLDLRHRTRYCLTSPSLREPLTSEGWVITHFSPQQLEWVFPGGIARELPPSVPATQCRWLWEFDEFAGAFDEHGDVIRSRFRESR